MSDSYRLSYRRIAFLSAGAVALTLVAGALVSQVSEDRSTTPSGTGGGTATTATVASGTTAFLSPTGGEPGTTAAQPAARPIVVRYTFDGGPGQQVQDDTGQFELHAKTAAGGVIGYARHGAGWAATFPPRCAASTRKCPRTILAGDGDPNALNPGTRGLRFGATILMRPSDTAAGANVLQKGYSVGGNGQFKLQVDGSAGRPSCVIASAARIYRVLAATRVADGQWHSVGCSRQGAVLSITVDGVTRGSIALPAGLSIVNSEPLRIGGKGLHSNNDQFAGQVDNIYVAID